MELNKWKKYAAIKRLMAKYGILEINHQDYERFNRELVAIMGL